MLNHYTVHYLYDIIYAKLHILCILEHVPIQNSIRQPSFNRKAKTILGVGVRSMLCLRTETE
jgi:hypothetical protein